MSQDCSIETVAALSPCTSTVQLSSWYTLYFPLFPFSFKFGGHQNDWQIARLKQDCNFELLPATTFIECSVLMVCLVGIGSNELSYLCIVRQCLSNSQTLRKQPESAWITKHEDLTNQNHHAHWFTLIHIDSTHWPWKWSCLHNFSGFLDVFPGHATHISPAFHSARNLHPNQELGPVGQKPQLKMVQLLETCYPKWAMLHYMISYHIIFYHIIIHCVM